MAENKTNLIINYLPQTMTDAQFQTLFESIGPTVSCRVIRDKNTGYSYGFGFVEYKDSKHATSAISTLNGYKIQHKVLKVSYSRPGGDKIKNTNLYIGNLPKDVDENKLKSVFKTYGTVIQSRILKDNNGISRGIGFVRYNFQDEAQLAIDSLNNKVLPGTDTIISIRISTSENDKKQRDMIQKYSKVKTVTSSFNNNNNNGNMFPPMFDMDPNQLMKANMMGNGGVDNGYMGMSSYFDPSYRARNPMMPYDTTGSDQFTYGVTTYNDLTNKFDGYDANDMFNGNKGQYFYDGFGQNAYESTPMKMRMPYNPRGMSMGYMPQMGSFPMMGNRPNKSLITLTGPRGEMQVRPPNQMQSMTKPNLFESTAAPVKSTGENKVLFVYNIGADTTEREITNLFWPYGTVLKVDIPKDTKNPILNKGFAFVMMSTTEEAMLAIQYLHNFAFKDKTLQVSIKKENPK